MNTEEKILGSIICDADILPEVAAKVEPKMIVDKKIREIYQFCLERWRACKSFEPNILNDRFKDDKQAITTIAGAVGSYITSTTIKDDIAQLKKEYMARVFNDIGKRMSADSTDVEEKMEKLQIFLDEMMKDKEYGIKTLGNVIAECRNNFFKEREMIHFGFPKLDSFIGRLDRQDVTVIGARPAVGKSAFSAQIAIQMANHGYKTGFVPLEMSEEQVAERMIAMYSWIPLQRVRNGISFLNDEESKFNGACNTLEKSNLYLIPHANTTTELYSIVKTMKLDILVVDYLQLLRAKGTYRGNRASEVAEISWDLKQIAKELNCHVILLSQLNRKSEDKQKPTMAELRESGAIEQDASNIIMLWNLKTEGEKGVEVVKCRNGRLGGVVFNFDGDHMAFTETDKDLRKEEKFETAKYNPWEKKNVDKD